MGVYRIWNRNTFLSVMLVVHSDRLLFLESSVVCPLVLLSRSCLVLLTLSSTLTLLVPCILYSQHGIVDSAHACQHNHQCSVFNRGNIGFVFPHQYSSGGGSILIKIGDRQNVSICKSYIIIKYSGLCDMCACIIVWHQILCSL